MVDTAARMPTGELMRSLEWCVRGCGASAAKAGFDFDGGTEPHRLQGPPACNALLHERRTQSMTSEGPLGKQETDTKSALVPAVERAATILRYLQDNADPTRCTVSRIAKEIHLHKSTCSYILRTLELTTLAEYDPNTKAYSLGAGLIGLGAAASRKRDILVIGSRPIETLVRQTELTCVTFTQLPNKSFLIIAKTDSPKEIKVTIDVGQYFAPGTPALARVAMASMSSSELNNYIDAHCQPKFTAVTKTGRAIILKEIEQVRRDGYAVSQSEYHAGYTVVVAPVFSPHDHVCRGICLIGFSSQIKTSDLAALGAQVRASAQVITQGLGGPKVSRSG
jgi:DNA-binding IclR family transcriptional regulator